MTGVPAAARCSSRSATSPSSSSCGSANPGCSTSPAAAAPWWIRRPSSTSACGGSSSSRRTACRLVSWAMPAEQRLRLLAAHLPRQRGQHLRGRTAVALRRPPGAGTQPVRVRLPRLRRERRRPHGAGSLSRRGRGLPVPARHAAGSAGADRRLRPLARLRRGGRAGEPGPGGRARARRRAHLRGRAGPGGLPVCPGSLDRGEPVPVDRAGRRSDPAQAVPPRAGATR